MLCSRNSRDIPLLWNIYITINTGDGESVVKLIDLASAFFIMLEKFLNKLLSFLLVLGFIAHNKFALINLVSFIGEVSLAS